jgi:hypothetical protein
MRAESIWNLIILSLLAVPAYGYTDPGSGLMLMQILGAMLVGLMFYARKIMTCLWPGKRKDRKQDRCAGAPGGDGHA